MPIPVVTCNADIALSYNASPQSVVLGATATNAPILSWGWIMRSVPVGSTAHIGTNGNFTDGISASQNPNVTLDGKVTGGYCFECVATNATGSSKPTLDKKSCQQLVIIKTNKHKLYLPGDYAYDYGQKYIDLSIRALEAANVMEDAPPSSPSIYDDEFDGIMLNPKWAWMFAGAPTSGVESYAVSSGKLNVTFGLDSAVKANFGTEAHILAQVAPASSFTITTKINYWPYVYNTCPVGIFLGASTYDAVNGPFLFGVAPRTPGYPNKTMALYCYTNSSTWVSVPSRTVSGINTYLRVVWNNSTQKVRAWVSNDGYGTLWMPATIDGPTGCRIGYNLTRFGLVFWAGRSVANSSDRDAASIEFFRVTIP